MSTGEILHAVIIKGELNYMMPENNEVKFLDPGSYFNSSGKSVHSIRNKSTNEAVVYIRTNGSINVLESE